MSDIVERLRQPWPPSCSEDPLMTEAADEITALRAEVERLKVEAAAQYADGAHDGSDRAQDLWAGEITALRAEVERLRQVLENNQQARVLQGKAITDASNEIEHLRAENERLRAELRDIIADSFSVYAIEVARAALEEGK